MARRIPSLKCLCEPPAARAHNGRVGTLNPIVPLIWYARLQNRIVPSQHDVMATENVPLPIVCRIWKVDGCRLCDQRFTYS